MAEHTDIGSAQPSCTLMSALGQSRHSERVSLTSALHQFTDISTPTRLVRFVPLTDACPVQSDLRSRFRSAFLRDRSVCFHNGIVESPTGNRAHTIEVGEDA